MRAGGGGAVATPTKVFEFVKINLCDPKSRNKCGSVNETRVSPSVPWLSQRFCRMGMNVFWMFSPCVEQCFWVARFSEKKIKKK